MATVEHFEIPADDVARAKSFYSTVFDWSMTDWDDENTMIDSAGESGIGGDIHKRGPVPHPTFVITVEDVDESLASVIANGGEAVGEIQPLEGMGRYCYFRDTEGNLIGLFDSQHD